MPKPMAKEGLVSLRRLTAYEINGDDVSRRGILFLKDNRNRRVAGFFASQLSYAVREETALLAISREDAVICSLPRGRRARLAHGHDQAELVARALSEKLGIPYLPLILRSREELGDQKTRNAAERLRAARRMFLLDEEIRRECAGKTVILVDDIVTTGSGMAASAELCRKAGVKFVLAFVISTSPDQRK